MHRLLARVLRERDQEAGRWPQTVTEALDLLEPSLFPAPRAQERREEGSRLVAHVDAAWAAAAAAMAGGNPLALGLARRLLRARVWAVRQLAGAADLAAAIEAGSRLLADCTELIGEDDRVTLAARHALAVAYKLSGQLTTARELYEQSLADRRRLFGDHDLDTLEALNDYAELHLALNLDGEHTYAERLAAVGPDHPDTDFVRGNLAFKYWLAGRLTEATALNEELYRARQRVFGDHQLTFIAATNLGACYAKTGQLEEAAVLHEETLEARLRLLGPANPDTMRSRHALALTYVDLGRYGEAISLHEENLTERVRYLSPDNPHIADTIVALEAARAAQPAGRG
jgi:tetratricopeptide (TPR) repeat protein